MQAIWVPVIIVASIALTVLFFFSFDTLEYQAGSKGRICWPFWCLLFRALQSRKIQTAGKYLRPSIAGEYSRRSPHECCNGFHLLPFCTVNPACWGIWIELQQVSLLHFGLFLPMILLNTSKPACSLKRKAAEVHELVTSKDHWDGGKTSLHQWQILRGDCQPFHSISTNGHSAKLDPLASVVKCWIKYLDSMGMGLTCDHLINSRGELCSL